MAWDQLSINRPHLAYIILGGFTSLFMLCSLFVKEKLYIGEATVATICGIIFGPHAANLFDPGTWGNVDQITLECSRIVLVVQCFAVGVELPKAYMERHWRSVVFLLIPVMTFGWLITSLFIWWMIEPLTWLESLCCAACVTATDPVLASSVVGKGKFAKRVPKHLRDLLSAESGCNDGMAFPFIYLSLYLMFYRPNASKVAYHWICFIILYECIFGAVYGFLVGYIARHAIKLAEKKELIDRESFLVFYFVLALFCAGTGSLLGLDDLLVGFAAGVGFSNDGWFTHKTEESHVSNVLDLLLNLAYFVYLGAIIPWQQYNAPELGITPWRLVVIAILVILFRRIPIMMALKPLIPDVRTWREALFAGHFGPIGVGAIFAVILTRAELETHGVTPLAELPGPGAEHYFIIQIIWPLTTFLVVSSILVHGSSIAVFTLGKRINTLSITMSYTQANEDGPSWMNRLPRISSTSKSMSKSKADEYSLNSSDEKLPAYPPGTLPPIGLPGSFLRRQKEEDNPSNSNSRASSLRPTVRRKKWDAGMGPGGPISQSAIAPQRRPDVLSPTESPSDTLNEKGSASPERDQSDEPANGLQMRVENDERRAEERHHPHHVDEPQVEAYQEGDEMIIEDEEGNVLDQADTRGESEDQKKQHIIDASEELQKETSGEHAKGKFHPHAKNEGEEVQQSVEHALKFPNRPFRNLKKKLGDWNGGAKSKEDAVPSDSNVEPRPREHKRGPAHAYQYGNTIIVEDEDGEVVKKYDIPPSERGQLNRRLSHVDPAHLRQRFHRMGTWAGLGGKDGEVHEAGPSNDAGNARKDAINKKRQKSVIDEDDDDDRIRFTVNTGGRRMGKEDFIKQIQQLDPKARCEMVEGSDAPEAVKQKARQDAKDHHRASTKSTEVRPPSLEERTSYHFPEPQDQASSGAEVGNQPSASMAQIQRTGSNETGTPHGAEGLTLVDSKGEDIPYHSVTDSIAKYSGGKSPSAAQSRRRAALRRMDSDDDGTERVPPSRPRRQQTAPIAAEAPSSRETGHTTVTRQESSLAAEGETKAERRRRLAALGEGEGNEADSDSEDDGAPRRPARGHEPVEEPVREPNRRTPGIRFADTPAVSQGRVQWGEDVGKRGRAR
ncbi:na h antiporter nha1 [Lasallia pustulata]|uniref:Na h antiporter nha1 n=1 Tax=Lasallia pustulata TaxID=136370 RepID=A0A1W5CZU6_9LECA|nr:na h antiporter nha1 [Lasallia pustulata]